MKSKFNFFLPAFFTRVKKVSQMNSPIAQAQSQNQTLHEYDAYNWSYGHFCDILTKILLPWQRPLDSWVKNVFFGLADHENPLL